MGRYRSDFRFEGPVPALDTVRAELRRRLGARPSALDSLEARGQVVRVTSFLAPFSHELVRAILEALGGQPLSPLDGEAVGFSAPAWAHEPLDARSESELAELHARWLERIGVATDEDRALWDDLQR